MKHNQTRVQTSSRFQKNASHAVWESRVFSSGFCGACYGRRTHIYVAALRFVTPMQRGDDTTIAYVSETFPAIPPKKVLRQPSA